MAEGRFDIGAPKSGGYETRPYDVGTPLHQLNRGYFPGEGEGLLTPLGKRTRL